MKSKSTKIYHLNTFYVLLMVEPPAASAISMFQQGAISHLLHSIVVFYTIQYECTNARTHAHIYARMSVHSNAHAYICAREYLLLGLKSVVCIEFIK